MSIWRGVHYFNNTALPGYAPTFTLTRLLLRRALRRRLNRRRRIGYTNTVHDCHAQAASVSRARYGVAVTRASLYTYNGKCWLGPGRQALTSFANDRFELFGACELKRG